MEILSLLLIGVGLSMDAFSLALCYGVLHFEKSKIIKIALTVGMFHFFMPLLGVTFGNFLEHFIVVDMRYIVFAIFMYIGAEMIIGVIKKETNFILLNNVGILLFAFTVSVDSFSAGVGIKFISDNYLLCSLIFSIASYTFTYVGLLIGTIVGAKFETGSKLVGGLILILFALSYLFKR